MTAGGGTRFDVAVVGLGAMGSAALLHLARRGARVVGIERFASGHDRGSSHGETRIIRLGYFEHPSYVPLLRRTYELWRELEAAAGVKLMHITGIVEIGPPDGTVVPGTLLASRMHGLTHEVLDADETMRRFPAFHVPKDYVGVFQPDGGFLAVEPAIEAQLALAHKAGAEIRTGETVHSIEANAAGVRIQTDKGVVDAAKVVVSAGPWAKQMLPQLPLRATRQVMAWFEPRDPAPFADGRFPVFLLESRHGVHYGFPPHGSGNVKIAKHHHADETVDPDTIDRAVSAADEALIRPALADHIPPANGRLVAAKTCLYTMTPDGDFIIDALPGAPNVIVASPCSGHGFKFAPVIGEIAANLALDGATRHDISRFKLDRFG
jgi:sarcosine oxidase